MVSVGFNKRDTLYSTEGGLNLFGIRTSIRGTKHPSNKMKTPINMFDLENKRIKDAYK